MKARSGTNERIATTIGNKEKDWMRRVFQGAWLDCYQDDERVAYKHTDIYAFVNIIESYDYRELENKIPQEYIYKFYDFTCAYIYPHVE